MEHGVRILSYSPLPAPSSTLSHTGSVERFDRVAAERSRPSVAHHPFKSKARLPQGAGPCCLRYCDVRGANL